MAAARRELTLGQLTAAKKKRLLPGCRSVTRLLHLKTEKNPWKPSAERTTGSSTEERKEFEVLAKMCKWSDLQKIAYAKKLLQGSYIYMHTYTLNSYLMNFFLPFPGEGSHVFQ